MLRQSQSRGNAAAAIVNNNGLKSEISSTLKTPSSDDETAPPDFVRLGIQRMLEQAQQNSNDNKYNGGSHSSDIENSKALQALELVQVCTRTRYTFGSHRTDYSNVLVYIKKENHPVELTHWSHILLALFLYL
jgi:hypothetical protein